MAKVVFIGAGSLGFTRGLVRDLLTFPLLQDAEIAFERIEPRIHGGAGPRGGQARRRVH